MDLFNEKDHTLLDELLERFEKILPEVKDAAEIPDPVIWVESAAGYILDPWQRDLMYSNESRELLLCSRQVGKTEGVAGKAAHEVAFTPGAQVAVIAPAQRQSINLADRIKSILMSSTPRLQFTSLSRTEIKVEGGGTLLALPGNDPHRVRGLALSRAIIDEAAYVKDSVMEVLFPMLATTNGRLTMLSTPSGPQGEFPRRMDR